MVDGTFPAVDAAIATASSTAVRPDCSRALRALSEVQPPPGPMISHPTTRFSATRITLGANPRTATARRTSGGRGPSAGRRTGPA